MLDVVVAVDEDVDVVRLQEHIVNMDKLEDIVSLRVAVVSAQGRWK